jgi:hypothetical protein
LRGEPCETAGIPRPNSLRVSRVTITSINARRHRARCTDAPRSADRLRGVCARVPARFTLAFQQAAQVDVREEHLHLSPNDFPRGLTDRCGLFGPGTSRILRPAASGAAAAPVARGVRDALVDAAVVALVAEQPDPVRVAAEPVAAHGHGRDVLVRRPSDSDGRVLGREPARAGRVRARVLRHGGRA